MPASRPILPTADEIDSHDALLVREATGKRRRRRLLGLAIVGGLVLLAAVAFGGRPALHAIKGWQARRHAREAVRLTDAGKMEEAQAKVQDALTIWKTEPQAQHAAAYFLTRAGAFRQALGFWQPLEAKGLLTTSDLRDYAKVELNLGDLDAAESLLRRAWPAGQAGTGADWILGMQIAMRRGRAADAAALAKRLLDDPVTPPRERLSAAAVTLSTTAGSPEDKLSAWKSIAAVALDGQSPESLAALVLLAQQRANPSATQPGENVVPALPDLLARIDANPAAKTQHHLLVLDLRAASEPAKKAEYIQAAIDRFGEIKDNSELATLAAWLYGKGEYEKALAVLPLARAVQDQALYLQYLDVLAALGRWTEIRELIQARKFPLDPVMSQMFLARCASQLGEPKVRDARWQAALDAAGTDPNKLLSVGQYASKNGVTRIAVAADEAALRVAPDLRAAHEELARLLEAAGETRKLRDALAVMAARWPQDLAIRNDAAYLDALLNENVPAARETARGLVRAEPGSIAHRTTLAMAELRLHHALAALDAFNGIDFAHATGLQARQAAVYAATLWETSYNADARAILKQVPMDRLLPEERELVQPLLSGATP